MHQVAVINKRKAPLKASKSDLFLCFLKQLKKRSKSQKNEKGLTGEENEEAKRMMI